MNIKLINWIDENIFSIPCRMSHSEKVTSSDLKRILVIKNWAIGDSVCLLPMIHALRLRYPKAQIDVLAHKKNKAVFEDQPDINNIIPFSSLGILKCICSKYDIAIDAEPFLNISAVIARHSAKCSIGFSHDIRSNMYNNVIDYHKDIHIVQNYLNFFLV